MAAVYLWLGYTRPVGTMTRILLILGGSISVALGIAGILVPVLPTTPFLLLAAFCYARSSERFHQWLLTRPWFGQYIYNYRHRRGILFRDKVVTLVVLWLTLGVTVVYAEPAWWVQLSLAVVGLGVTTHVVRLNTLERIARPEE